MSKPPSQDSFILNPLLHVEAWSAWMSGVRSVADWQQYFNPKRAACIEREHRVADVSFLTPMQRRRLSPLARAALHVANQCMNGDDMPSVFCSHFGEIRRTHALLESIGQQETVSPLNFSLSIHNAISAQFSLLEGNKLGSTALSPADGGYLVAIAEAQGMLLEGAGAVLIVYYEDALPNFYAPYIQSVSSPLALAMRVSLATEKSRVTAFRLKFRSSESPLATDTQALFSLIQFLVNKESMIQQAGWQLWRE